MDDRKREAKRRYRLSEKGKKIAELYRLSEKGQQSIKQYERSEKGRARKRRWWAKRMQQIPRKKETEKRQLVESGAINHIDLLEGREKVIFCDYYGIDTEPRSMPQIAADFSVTKQSIHLTIKRAKERLLKVALALK